MYFRLLPLPMFSRLVLWGTHAGRQTLIYFSGGDLPGACALVLVSRAVLLCNTRLPPLVNPLPAGVFGRTRPAEGGGGIPPPPHCLTLEWMAVARRARWQTLALVEYFLSN